MITRDIPIYPSGESEGFLMFDDSSLCQIEINNTFLKSFSSQQPLSLTDNHFICSVSDLYQTLERIEAIAENNNQSKLFNIYLTVVASPARKEKQKDTENALYQANYHLDAKEWFARSYEKLADARTFETTTFVRVKKLGNRLSEVKNLLIERDLHMDMLREFSCRSDAHVYRYVFAATYLRPKDTILDCACGLGYGSYLMSCSTKAGDVTGVDICSESVAYANDTYAKSNLNYKVLDIDLHEKSEFERVDVITSFETIEHVRDYHAFFKLCLRALKPDGRVIASVPHMWVDETGKDPNPYHFHEFDWIKFKTLFEEYGFIVEQRFHQAAPGGFKLTSAKRRFSQIQVDCDDQDTEWLIIVATPDLTHHLWSTAAKSVNYINNEYNLNALPVFVDFKQGYQNPWLHRQVIQIGQRIADDRIRINYVIKLLALGSEDQEALMCMLGYGLEHQSQYTQMEWLAITTDILNCKSDLDLETSPFSLRWRVSLLFLFAKKQFEAMDFASAKRSFLRLLELDSSIFCSVLLIKNIESLYLLAKIALINRDRENALQLLTEAKKLAFKSVNRMHEHVAVQDDVSAKFLWSEMADLFDAAAMVNSLHSELVDQIPNNTLLWNTELTEKNKRFGLFSYVKQLESSLQTPENKNLIEMKNIAVSIADKLVKKYIDAGMKAPILIWGTAGLAVEVFNKLSKLKISTAGFIDSNAYVGQMLCDKPVVLPTQIQQFNPSCIILTSISSGEYIASTLPKEITCVLVS